MDKKKLKENSFYNNSMFFEECQVLKTIEKERGSTINDDPLLLL
jgi:hypothetical protein